MPDKVLNTPLDETSKLDRSSKWVLLWKPGVFIALPIIQNQSKTKTIPHTVFKTFINNGSRYSKGSFELEIVEAFTRAFYL